MVKAGNYNYPELVVLPESEIVRMKVPPPIHSE
jgi:hypothetical protein